MCLYVLVNLLALSNSLSLSLSVCVCVCVCVPVSVCVCVCVYVCVCVCVCVCVWQVADAAPSVVVPYPLLPSEVRWFYQEPGKFWQAFSGYDSLSLEEAYLRQLEKGSSEADVMVMGELHEVSVRDRTCRPIYWTGSGLAVLVSYELAKCYYHHLVNLAALAACYNCSVSF